MSRVLRITDANTRRVSNATFADWTNSSTPGGNWLKNGAPAIVQVRNENTINTKAGAYACQIPNGGSDNLFGIYQDINGFFEAGQTVYVKVWVNPISGTGQLYVWDGSSFSNAVIAESTTDTEWQELVVKKTADSSGNIRVGLMCFNTGDEAVFDLVQVGTFHIEFIEGVESSVFRVTNWEMEIPDYKGGGVFASSPVADGRKLIDGYWDNVTQTITFHLRGDSDTSITSQELAVDKISELLSALQAARDYQSTDWVLDPVYIQHKYEGADDYLYATIITARVPQLADQYSIEFKQLVMLDLDLVIEHGIFTGLPLGMGNAVLAGTTRNYESNDYGNIDDGGDYYPVGDFVYVTNKQNVMQITNMHQGTGGANQIGGSLPRVIVAASGTTYFGIDSTLTNAGPFSNIIFNISRAGAGFPTLVWEYYSWATASWQTLTVYDTSSSFSILGAHSVAFRVEPNWGLVSPGGSLPSGWWVRCRVSSGSYSTTPQIETEIYTANWNYIEIPAGTVNGNVPALAVIEAMNVSMPLVTVTEVYRIIGGLRSDSRNDVVNGSLFQSIINLGNRQNSGVTVTYSSMSSVQYDGDGDTDTEASTGWGAQIAVSTSGYLEISIANANAKNYIGEFRCFAIASDVGSADLTVQMGYRQTSVMGYEYNEVVQVVSTQDNQVLDLGLIVITADDVGSLSPDELSIRLNVDNGTGFLSVLSAFVMIPVDEFHFDAALGDLSELTDTSWDYQGDMAVFGSARFSKNPQRTYFNVVETSFDTLAARTRVRWVSRSNGPMILQSQAKQRLHMLVLSYSSSTWRCHYSPLFKMRMLANPRYLGMRGSQ